MNAIFEALLSHVPAMWRRRWIVMVVAWVACLVGWGAVALIPNVYSTATTVYVETESLLRPLLQGMTIDVGTDKLRIMNQTLTSRPNLEKVVRVVGLGGSSPADFNAAVTKVQKDISVRMSERNNTFTISYGARDPEVAFRVVDTLLTIFVESNLGFARQELDVAREFIGKQVKEYEERVAEAERKLADFKRENTEFLPGASTYREYLDGLRRETAAIAAEIADTKAKVASMTTQLGDLKPMVPSGGAAAMSPLQMRVEQMRASLDDLKLRYTEKHPAMEETRRQLAILEDRLRSEGGSSAGGMGAIPNPVYENVRMEKVALTAQIAALENRFTRKTEEVAQLEAKAPRVPEVEAEFTRLTRDAELVRRQFEELQARQEAAKLSQSREMEAEKVQFRVINPPQKAQHPSGIKRSLLITAVLFGGLGLGLALTFLISAMQSTFYSPYRIIHALGVPVIGTISFIAPRRTLGSKLALGSFSASALLLVVAWMALMLVEYQWGLPTLLPQRLQDQFSFPMTASLASGHSLPAQPAV
ncbi:lipopolysaccharide biosynthesis [Rhodospirillum rubrum F11]|uniref:Lipopolysaccharide biosynthesis n=3 Tax=Rhodospirillum rubrum TaxID=1085 RepID=Q2RPN2_RHORT|nr:XrtA system polysaccharide chain length determinant [Rhodospirillum rubrum]ABC23913.1 Lipopolysaccharide biosynthesis [Rhodospirillum rubrum ATCC 11170]AEO49657.1 lipopolysaccharide biosynthesis [Rhodospirillum rubrum F11]MBK5955589.1 chain-length determining protein [Rhodospirillum rubrum]QXG79857.1 chain-length determining protein [Rhodospirillum rubrum]HCF19541.1 chain-length determining protein [Rhodospirillum rubrum]